MFDKKINILKQAENGVGLLTIEATVPTGFELVAKDECLKLFGPDTTIYDYRGSIFFNIPIKDYNKVSKLRCIDHLFLVGPYFENVEVFCKNNPNFENTDVVKQKDLKLIGELAEKEHMDTTLKAWREIINFKGNAIPTKEEYLNYKVAVENKEKDIHDTKKVLKFRATCYRSGSHTFSSMEAATVFGGKLQDNFHWVVDLSDFDLNVVLNISGNAAYIALALTKESLHKRNITHFGPTTLRATVAYGLIHLVDPKPGDIILDPLTGGGSIPIESSLAFPYSFNICSDIKKDAVFRSMKNIRDLCEKREKALPIDVLKLNAERMMLRTASVDAVVTDLPFGKRSGLRKNNKSLYHKVLQEAGRVVRPDVGRAVFVTHDRRAFEIVFSDSSLFWKLKRQFGINLGGLNATVFHLMRTSNSWFKL